MRGCGYTIVYGIAVCRHIGSIFAGTKGEVCLFHTVPATTRR
jgi:hypothetical protein